MVKALAERAGTAGEQQAAAAALERISGASALAPSEDKRQSLTDALVRRLPAPAKGNKITYDADLAGFGCRVTAAGARSFVFNYRVKGTGQERRVTVGQFPSWSASAARTEAKRLRHVVDGGGDPRGDAEDLRQAPTVADLCDRFEREYLPRKRQTTVDAYSRLIRLHIKPHFGKYTKVADVAFSDIDRLHRNVTKTGSVYSANRCVAVLSKMFSLAIQWQMRDTNPAKGIERNAEVKRKRYLSGDELARLTTALAKHPDKQFADIIRLLMLTGARKMEVMSIKFSDITFAKDKGVWTKLGSTTKQKSDHVVPLSAPAVQLLSGIKRRGEFVFPGDGKTGHVVEIKKGWAALCQDADITGLRIHDLRHSFASQLVSSGASLELIGALLGHSNPSTTARYSHLFDDPQRAAVEKVGAIVGNAAKSELQS